MRANLDRLGDLVHSQRVLLVLTQAGMARENAYSAVQRAATAVRNGQGTFGDLLAADQEIATYLSRSALDEVFDLAHYLCHVDTVFKRVFGA